MTDLPGQDIVAVHPTDRRRYLFGLFISSIGGGMVSLVGSYLAYQKTHHASAVALIIVFSNVPSLFLPTVATKLAYRWGGPKGYVVIWSVHYLLSLIPSVLDLTGHLNATTLLAWFLLEGIIQGFVTPRSGAGAHDPRPTGDRLGVQWGRHPCGFPGHGDRHPRRRRGAGTRRPGIDLSLRRPERRSDRPRAGPPPHRRCNRYTEVFVCRRRR